MKKILILSSAGWAAAETKTVSKALRRMPVEISTGNAPEMLPGMDYMLVLLGNEEGSCSKTLREMGVAARAHGVEIAYANLSTVAVADKITSLVATR